MHREKQARIWIWTASGRRKYAGKGLYFRLGEILTLAERFPKMWGARARRHFQPGLWTIPISGSHKDKFTFQLHGVCGPKGSQRGSQSPHPWRDSKAMWMWHFGTWGRGGFGSAGEHLDLDHIKDLFQPQWFCEAEMANVILTSYTGAPCSGAE